MKATKVKKFGNSHYIPLPIQKVRELDLKPGDFVSIDKITKVEQRFIEAQPKSKQEKL